ncbi:hypothetical protein P148_SR1C00001G0744 [candidate division SR1 bacterium RAAC1_SR1_1]|nr:hypothetical protein P148_SR1C00001G0744 [candidate division SR1 bacterium RAAC1_SR1_1]
MIKIFGLVLDLLQIPFSAEYVSLAEKMIENPDYKIVSFSSQGFVFLAFQELLLKKISEEEFVALGDSFGNLYHYQNTPIFVKEALLYGLVHEPESYANTYILFPKEEKVYLEKAIPSLLTIVKKIKSQIFYV